MIRSVLKLNPAHFMADFPLDVMLAPSAVSGEDGLDAMRALLMTYLLRGGHAIHFNIFSTETLKEAQTHPEPVRRPAGPGLRLERPLEQPQPPGAGQLPDSGGSK